MRAGLMDRRIQLQQNTAGVWSTTRSDWARPIKHGALVSSALARATENELRVFGAREVPNELTLYGIRYDAAITPAWRVIDEDGDILNIIGVSEGDGRKRETVLACVPFASSEEVHDDLLEELLDHGVAITFTKTMQSHDPLTDELTEIVVTVAGRAIRVDGDPIVYERLSLTESDAPTLLFAATTYGEVPDIGSRTTWAGQVYTVREVLPDAPTGTVTSARVVIQ